MAPRKANITLESANLTWDQIEKSEPVFGIDAIAVYCNVDAAKVSEWIGSRVFPAWWDAPTCQHCIRKGDLDEWIANGFKPTPCKSYQKMISTDIILTFKDFEVGKNCMAASSFRIPLIWKPKIDQIMENYKQFEGRLSNFFRCALYNLIADLDTLAEMNGHESSPEFKTMLASAKINEHVSLNDRMLAGVKKTCKDLARIKNPEKIREYIEILKSQVDLFSPPWDRRVRKYLTGLYDLLKTSERRSKAEEDDDDDMFDGDEDDDGFAE